MASEHVEVEAAKLLHKLIQESKDEPAKLAMKLHVICQHMRSSGKEQSLPYQVISRAMETVVSQHGLDVDILRPTRLPFPGGPQMTDSGPVRSKDKEIVDNQLPKSAVGVPHPSLPGSNWQAALSSQTKEAPYAGSFQNYGMPNDSKTTPDRTLMARPDMLVANRPSVSIGADLRQGPVSQKSSKSSDHESPASLLMEDTRSANSQERTESEKLDSHTSKKDTKKTSSKRQREDSKAGAHLLSDSIHQPDTLGTGPNSRKGKQMSKAALQGQFAMRSGDHVQLNSAQNTSHSEHLSLVSERAKQEDSQFLMGRTTNNAKIPNSNLANPITKLPEEGEVSSSGNVFGLQKGLPPSRSSTAHSTSIWNQNRVGLPSENSQGSIPAFVESSPLINKSMYSVNDPKNNMHDVTGDRSLPMIHSHGIGKINTGTSGAVSSFPTQMMGLSAPYNNSTFESQNFLAKSHKEASIETSRSSHFLDKGKNVIGNSPSMEYPSFFPAKAEGDPENRKAVQYPDKQLESKVDSSSNVLESSTAFISSDKARDTSRTVGNAYNTHQGGGIQQWQIKGNLSLKDEAVHQMNREFYNKQKSAVNLCDEPPKMMDVNALRSTAPKSIGSGLMSQASSSNTPFREQHLKQLRAQCLVFLAFRNNLMPRKLHLEIALGGSYPQEGGIEDAAPKGNANRGDMNTKEPANSHESSSMFGRQNDIMRITPAPGSSSTGGSVMEADSSKDTENTKNTKKLPNADTSSLMAEESKQLPEFRQKPVSEMQAQGTADSCSPTTAQQDSRSPTPVHQETDSLGHAPEGGYPSHCPQEHTQRANNQGKWTSKFSSTPGMNTHYNIDRTNISKARVYEDPSNASPAISMMYREQPSGRLGADSSKSRIISSGDSVGKLSKPDSLMSEANTLGDAPHPYPLKKEQNAQPAEVLNSQHLIPLKFTHVGPTEKLSVPPKQLLSSGMADTFSGSSGSNGQRISAIKRHDMQKLCDSDGLKPPTAENVINHENPGTLREISTEQEEEYTSESDEMPASPPKYTTSEKWIKGYKRRKLVEKQAWVLKQRKADERIKACFDKSKENVSSSEDLSAKTKNIIELKKLQLLQLQRRLRSDFLNDYFKPITTDMERLKSTKKHRDGRRKKQLEKYEQRMKEERQKRIRERQKEFFGEVETHRERLEDSFKIKRERLKGFNKYMKEFHKRKERIHREKIDKIQREKINLLKNNDVEGYLRMVQDAKSDRVKQLLKETENYLKKLSSKLQESKTISRRSEMEMDESRAPSVVEINDIAYDNEDESDQAQHYLVSNEKYYTMAHSVKESINEQPASLEGGKLREYQMNGLRWLVSLYNNHLNGILADEMGLGKTVQVIALICYLMEAKKDRGPFLVVVPSSVLPGWESELNFWAPGINKIVYSGQPEERRRLFKECITHQKFNVLLTTYEYLMNKQDRPKLCKIHWRYIIIDEGHRIKNASCKLNADLKLYQSSHRLLLTGTPLQNNLEELWALLNFLLPDIFNSSDDFSQWFNKPFEGTGDNSAEEALLSEEENLLIINRLHQVLRPFVLRRLKHKVENQLPEKIERLVRCEASAYQQLLMKRVEENLGVMGNAKGRSVHNTVMELRNICNHPYLSQLHAEEINHSVPKHYLPPIVRLCGKLEMLDRILPKLKATDHRVLFFSTMTRLLDVMEDYLTWKQYKYLRLDGHTAGGDRGALIREFNRPDSPAFIFLLSIRAGGVGVNLQAADTVIIFDTDWNPQVDLQAQARAHRIGQKKDVLVLRLETVRTVEEHVRAAAEHKLGVANQSITAGFFDNNTSAEDRREYLESLLREGKKEEASPVLDDDGLNYLLARSESEIDVFEAVDKQRREDEMTAWQRLIQEMSIDGSERLIQEMSIDGSEPLPLPSRLVTEEDLKSFYETMRMYELANVGAKRKGEHVGSLDTQHYGRGKRAREVRSYEEQLTEEEFEKLVQVDSALLLEPADTLNYSVDNPEMQLSQSRSILSVEQVQPGKERKPPVKRGRGRPKRTAVDTQPPVVPALSNIVLTDAVPDSDPAKDSCLVAGDGILALPPPGLSIPLPPKGRGRKQKVLPSVATLPAVPALSDNVSTADPAKDHCIVAGDVTSALPPPGPSVPLQPKGRGRKPRALPSERVPKPRETSRGRGRGRKQKIVPSEVGILGSTDATSNTSSVPSMTYVANPSIGSQAEADLASFPASSSQGQDKLKDNFQATDTRETVDSNLTEKLAAKYDDGSHLNTSVDALKASSMISASGVTAEIIDYQSLMTAEFVKRQEHAIAAKAPDLNPGTIKDETLSVTASGQIHCSPNKDGTAVSVVRKQPENKASVTRKKAAAREPRTRSNSTAACERRARLAGLKQVEGLMVDSKGKSVKAANVGKKPEADFSPSVDSSETDGNATRFINTNLSQTNTSEICGSDITLIKSVTELSRTSEAGIVDNSPSTKTAVLVPCPMVGKNRNENAYQAHAKDCIPESLTTKADKSDAIATSVELGEKPPNVNKSLLTGSESSGIVKQSSDTIEGYLANKDCFLSPGIDKVIVQSSKVNPAPGFVTCNLNSSGIEEDEVVDTREQILPSEDSSGTQINAVLSSTADVVVLNEVSIEPASSFTQDVTVGIADCKETGGAALENRDRININEVAEADALLKQDDLSAVTYPTVDSKLGQ